ncbi:type I polyketide synthase [Streptomyces sp. GD-15H]|uniref:type I polyketide synthase n=1 Tax=Streptomyces sp. GD-15H TaxID=3129112 RepID=UPI003243EEBE
MRRGDSDDGRARVHGHRGAAGCGGCGVGGAVSRAGGVEEFWANVCGGVESIVPLEEEELAAAGVPPEVFGRSDYVRAAPRFEGAGLFDAEFFGYTAREAEVMDPQHRLFLETCWQALEDAGYDAARFDGSVGVFGGASTTAYLENIFSNLDHGEALRGKNIGLGFELAFLTSRVSHKLDLKGPSFPVQTACSTSLVAVHAACQSLQNFECDMALSGAVAFKVPENTGYLYQDGSFLSPDGHVRPFDAEARGTVFGSGVGVVVLKRLEDALADGDTIHAVVKGSAIGNDGAVKASFTAPSVAGQAEVITEALAVAGVEPEEIDYIETHGTGTLVGDSIEVQALGRVFGGRGRCALGSVKGNVGHLDAAAGMAGLIKTVLAVEHGVLPPTVNHRRVNPEVDLAGGRFRVQTALEEWPRTGRARRAGVSAFGFGGSNAHVVVEQAPPGRVETGDARGVAALVLSARSERALEEATDRLAAHLRERRPELSDAAYTLAVGRRVFPYRRTVVGSDAEEIARALEARDPAVVTTGHTVRESAPVVFLFGGQGSQHPGMAGGLYRDEPVFREAVDECARLLEPLLETDIRDVLCAEAEDRSVAARLEETRWAQPALFVVQYALARLWQSWGITPGAVIGHSLGEWTAACVAGVFSLPDALALVALRGRLMQEQAPGGMLNTMADRSAVEGVLPQGVALAAHNGPRDCVVSGPHDALAVFAELAAERGWPTQRVATSHAFHCALMEPVVGVFTEAVAAVERRAPRVPVVSNVTGTWLTDAEAVDPGYWGRHIRSTVEFDAGVRTAAGAAGSVVLEIGPGQAFTGLARRILAAADAGAGAQAATALASLPHRRDRRTPVETLHRALALLWQSGAGPDWKGYYHGQHRRRIPLPTHPLHPRHHWLEKAVPRPAAPTEQAPHPLLDELVLRSLGQSVFRTELSVERHWVLSEHRLLGEAIVPGTTYLEMARAAAAVHFGRPVTELRDVTFLVPLLVPDGTARTVHTTVRDLTDGLAEFTVASRDAVDDGWTVHARGTAAVGPFAERTPQQDLAELRRICALETVDTGERLDAHRTMTFGPRWRESLPAVHIGVNVALGRLDLPGRPSDRVRAVRSASRAARPRHGVQRVRRPGG